MADTPNPASTLATRGPLFAATDAIQARLQMVFPPRLFEHGMLPAAPTREIWLKLVRRTPYVGVTWLGATPAASSGRQLRLSASWRVLLVTSHADVAARFTGDRLGVGQFGMAQVAAAILHGFTPPPADDVAGFGSLAVTDLAALSADWSDAAEAIAGITVTSDFELVDSTDLLDLLRLRGGWSLDGSDDIAAIAAEDFTGSP